MPTPSAAFSMSIEWTTPPSVIAHGLQTYKAKLLTILQTVVAYYGQAIENYAKQNAPWTDRTGAARQGLRVETSVDDAGSAGHTGRISLIHGVSYGIWLELAHGGKYAIIQQALQAHYAAIMQTIQEQLG